MPDGTTDHLPRPEPPGHVPALAAQVPNILAAVHARDGQSIAALAPGPDAEIIVSPDETLRFLVAFKPQASLIDHVGLQLDLEELLDVDVEVVAAGSPAAGELVAGTVRPL